MSIALEETAVTRNPAGASGRAVRRILCTSAFSYELTTTNTGFKGLIVTHLE